jgi:1-acyl-sn-glycerol-3-phosphate acyltransferase
MTVVLSWLRILVGVLFIGGVLLTFLPLMLLCFPSRRYRIYLGNYSGKIIGRSMLWLAGATPSDDRIHQYPAIYISNHTSLLDIFLGIWLGPVGTCGVAKKQVVWYPFFGQLYWLAGHLRIDRGNHEKAIAAMSEMAELQKKYNLSVWLWPEGTRSRDGRLRGFKKGFGHMAIATGLPIVPVVVAGAQKAWRHGSWQIHPTDLKITVMEAIPTTDWTLDNLDEKIKQVHDAMEALLPAEQRSTAPAGALEFGEAVGELRELEAK